MTSARVDDVSVDDVSTHHASRVLTSSSHHSTWLTCVCHFFVLLFIHSSYTHHLLTGYGPVARLPCVLSLYCSSVVVVFVVPFVVILVPRVSSKTFPVSP